MSVPNTFADQQGFVPAAEIDEDFASLTETGSFATLTVSGASTLTGPVSAPGGVTGALTGNADTATIANEGAPEFSINGNAAMRISIGSALNSGLVSVVTSVPGTGAVGQVFLVVAAM